MTVSIWISPVDRSEERKGEAAEDAIENDRSLLDEIYEPLYRDEDISSCLASPLLAEDVVFYPSSEWLVIPAQDGYGTMKTHHHSVKRKEEKVDLRPGGEGVRHRGRARQTMDVQHGRGDS